MNEPQRILWMESDENFHTKQTSWGFFLFLCHQNKTKFFRENNFYFSIHALNLSKCFDSFKCKKSLCLSSPFQALFLSYISTSSSSTLSSCYLSTLIYLCLKLITMFKWVIPGLFLIQFGVFSSMNSILQRLSVKIEPYNIYSGDSNS